MKNEIQIISKISLSNISEQIIVHSLPDKDLVKFALSLGYGGDYTYEFLLIEEAIKLVSKIYPKSSLSDEDGDFKKLMSLLSDCKPLLRNTNNL